MDERSVGGFKWCGCCAWHSVSPESPIACHAEAMCEDRSILLCWLRLRRGFLSFAWPFPRLCISSITNSADFVLLFGSGRGALATSLAELLFVQIGFELFIGKTTADNQGKYTYAP